MNNSKTITTLLRPIVENDVAGCECGGSGYMAPWAGDDSKECPTCAEKRELLKELNGDRLDMVCSEKRECPEENGINNSCEGCEVLDWPDLTTAMRDDRLLLVDWLDRAGLIKRFAKYLIETCEYKGLNQFAPVAGEKIFKTATTGKRLCQAVEAFLKERGNDKDK